MRTCAIVLILCILFLSLAFGQKRLASLNSARADLAACTVGQKAFFAGGWDGLSPSDKVDIYDATTQTWTVSNLSVARVDLVAASAGTYAIFAGGISDGRISDVVDIYNVATDSWTVSKLSAPRHDLAGNHKLFSFMFSRLLIS